MVRSAPRGLLSPTLLSLAALAAVVICHAADDHDGHNHDHDGHDHEEGSASWEWAGVFTFEGDERYSWTLVRGADENYAAHHLKMVIVPTSDTTHEAIHDTETTAQGFWDGASAEIESGSVLNFGLNGGSYTLETDPASWISLFHFQAPQAGSYVFFLEHLPTEFENGFHFLRDPHGHDLEPSVAESSGGEHAGDGHEGHDHDEEEAEEHKRWGLVIGASLVTCSPTIFCVMLAAIGYFCFKNVIAARLSQESVETAFDNAKAAVFAFASGAIFGCAVFLLLSEALFMCGADQDETTGTWTWGMSILLGWGISLIIRHASDILFPAQEVEANSKESGGLGLFRNKLNLGTTCPILLGDFFHNFVDGMVIGIAAKNCDTSMVWTIAGVTTAHEAPQELADFLVMVSKGGVHWALAMCGNIISSLSTVVGACLIHGTDVSENWQGRGLAFGAGVYIYVAITDLAPEIMNLNIKSSDPKSKALQASFVRLLAFTVGATAIGLVLLKHEHCDAGHDHAGHAH